MSWSILEGDVRERLAELDAESVQTVVTSPPYWGLRDYGIEPVVWGGDPDCIHEWGEPIVDRATNHTDKRRWQHTRNGRDEEQPPEKRVAWRRTDVGQGAYCECGAWCGSLGLEPTPEQYVANLVSVFREVRRVLRDDGTLWLNLGDSYTSGGRDYYVADTSRPERAVSTRPGVPAGLKAKDLVGIPWRVAFALQADGWWLRMDNIWNKPNPMPESVTDRPTRSHEYLFLLTKSARYFYDTEAIKEPSDGRTHHDVTGTGYAAPGQTEQNGNRKQDGHDRRHEGFNGRYFAQPAPMTRNKRSVWTVPTQPYPDAHFATFPPKLIEPCILAGSKPGGLSERGQRSVGTTRPDEGDNPASLAESTVLDPFAGSGTTGLVALRHERSFVGIELNPDYCELARNRIRDDAPLLNAQLENAA